jgi:hypothetical protein
VLPSPPEPKGVPLGEIVALLLTSERRDVELAPGIAHLHVPTTVDEVRKGDSVAVVVEGVGAMHLADAEI